MENQEITVEELLKRYAALERDFQDIIVVLQESYVTD